MKLIEKIQELEALAQKKGVRVSYEVLPGEVGAGGLCKVKGEYRAIIDKRALPAERLTMLADALAFFSYDDIYLPPEVRELMDRALARKKPREKTS